MGNAKGTVLIGAVQYLRDHAEDAQKVLPEDLHHYLSKRVSPAVWYPEPDFLALLRAMVELMPGSDEHVLRGLGVMTAKNLGEGIYRHLVKDGGNDSTTHALWASMHDTGELTMSSDEKRVVNFRLEGYEHACSEMCTIIGAYIQETIRMGGREALVSQTECVLTGAPACCWRATW